jgi:hypothetical protein
MTWIGSRPNGGVCQLQSNDGGTAVIASCGGCGI